MLVEMGQRARAAARQLARATTRQKDTTLLALAEALLVGQDDIFAANAQDVEAGQAAGLTPALIDRLTLNPKRLAGVASDLSNVAALPDPVGEVFDAATLPNGLNIHRQRVPLGVLGVIYESRPNVTVDVAGLAIKTGNASILRGGKETIRSNQALVAMVRRVLMECDFPADAVQLLESPDRALMAELLTLDEYVDMIIPRGGAALHKFCRENSRIPVMVGGIGICHLFVDESADLDAALKIIHNAKTQRPSVCNALDTVLVHRSVAPQFLGRVVEYLAPDGVTFRAHESAQPFVSTDGGPVLPAGPDDFDTEWMSLVLGLKVVDTLDEAMEHIAAHSQNHSDGILTRNQANAARFVSEVDSSAVLVNASTRFNDGGQLGLGAEVAVSTQKLHARGPMGLRELTTYKWVVIGEGHVRPG